MRIFVWLVLGVATLLTIFPSSLLAQQQVSPSTKKNVVKNFKANLSQYSAFGSDCSKKPQGDASCDGAINEFDLSLWEVEFNASGGVKRSDFNNDGVVSLLDFGVWRNTVYPSPKAASILDQFASKLSYLITHNPLLITVFAQESASGGGEINSSFTTTSSSGSSLVVNSLPGGNTQQVNFDPQGNPQSAAFYNTNGQSYAEVAFLATGGTVISTQQSGVQVLISQTPSGPVIENFKNPDGSLLAIKSWPTQASRDAGEPPLSVTIPGQGAFREVLNIQPNGDGIVEKTDSFGNVLSRSQLRANGTLLTQDFQNKTLTESNSQVGFTTLSMKNSIGGSTSYMFFQGSLYAIAQTDSNKGAFIAQPLNETGDSWRFESHINGQKSEKTVADPILELNSNTPNPKLLVQYINYYKQVAPDPNAVNFSDGFPTNANIQTRINKANAILTITQAAPPSGVLGIIKEAFAAGYESQGENIDNGQTRQGHQNFVNPANGDWISTQVNGGGSGGNGQVTVEVTFGNPTTNPGGTNYQFTSTRSTFEGLGVEPGVGNAAGEPMDIIDVTKVLDSARNGTLSSTRDGSDIADLSSIPSIVTTTENPATQPELPPANTGQAPALPPPPPPPQAPAPGTQLANQVRDDWSKPQAVAATAASVATSTPPSAPQSNFIAPGIYSSVGVVVDNNLNPTGMYQSSITGGDHGTAIQYHNPTTGYSEWHDDRGTFTSHSGTLTGVSFTGGGSYAITSDGLVVDVSGLGATGAFNPDGTLNAQVEAVAREHSVVTDQSIIDSVYNAAAEQITANGGSVSGGALSNIGTCFLPGTKISTPLGLKNIEDFKVGDKVYSYNEITGEKQVSNFKELDINFVDEYLIINRIIRTTVYHPFYKLPSNDHLLDSRLRGNDKLVTVRADQLKLGDILQNEQGKYIPVYSIEKVNAPKTTVYNLMNVSPNNNFFAQGVLVHNYGGEDPSGVDPSSTNPVSSEITGQSDAGATQDNGWGDSSTWGGPSDAGNYTGDYTSSYTDSYTDGYTGDYGGNDGNSGQ